jgi:tetratricopeptide (TPR) repeat protein
MSKNMSDLITSAAPEQVGKTALLSALDPYEIGQRIRQLRVTKGYKQKELIEDQFSKSYISSIEAGRLLPSPRAFEFFAERLGVSVAHLQWGSETPPEDLTVESGITGRASLEPQRSPGLRKRLNWELVLTMAQVELERGNPEAARDQLLEQGAPSPEVSPTLAARYYLLMGAAHLRLSDIKAALSEFSRAQDIAQSIPDREMVARLLNYIGQCYYTQNRYSEAVNYRRQAFEAIKRGEIKDPAFESQVYYSLANDLCLLNEQEQGVPLYQQAVELASQLNDRERLANSYWELSSTYHRQGNLTLARHYAERSLSLYEDLNNLKLATTIKSSFAQVLIDRHSYAEAEQYLQSALNLALELKNHSAAATAASNLSLVYMNLKDVAGEEKHALQGVEQAEQSNDGVVLGQSLARVANMYAARHNSEEADRYFSQAVEKLESLGAHQVLGGIYFEYGRTLMNQGRDREAAGLFEKAYMLQSGYAPRR